MTPDSETSNTTIPPQEPPPPTSTNPPPLPKTPPQKRYLLGFLLAFVVGSLFANLILLIALIGSLSLGGLKSHKGNFEPFTEVLIGKGGDPNSKIAVIPLTGIIGFGEVSPLGESLVEDFKVALDQAANDPHVKAVIIDTDSPGGEVTASDVLYHAVKTFPADKPVLVYFNSIGASGAYYMACGADWIMCNHTTFTGSIGVIISTLNYRELFGKIGLESLTFKSGKFKDMLNGARKITPEEKDYVEGLVLQSYGRFLSIVSKSRNLSEDSLRKGPADGRILSGTDAFQEKLVDQLGYLEDAFAKAKDLAAAPNAQVVRYQKEYSLRDFFSLLSSSKPARLEVHLPFPEKPSLKPGRLYLLPPFLAP